jgi:hypothetical protein
MSLFKVRGRGQRGFADGIEGRGYWLDRVMPTTVLIFQGQSGSFREFVDENTAI